MTKFIDTNLFIQIIEAEGAVHTGYVDPENALILSFLGKNGKVVFICTEDDTIDENTAERLLNDLGMWHLFNLIFPKKQIEQV